MIKQFYLLSFFGTRYVM